MADSLDRDRKPFSEDRKQFKKRRGRGGRKEKDVLPPTQPPKTPIILAKPDRPSIGSGPSGSSSSQDIPAGPDKPQVLVLKTRDRDDAHLSSASSSGSSIATSQSGDQPERAPQPSYQIQRNPSVSSVSSPVPPMPDGLSRLAAPPDMQSSVKLVEECMLWCDNGMEMLLDQSDFFTIGILGCQGSGKSTIMSLLGGNDQWDPVKSFVFKPQMRDTREVGAHQTVGIDMYVTPQRIILLDTQPILSASVLDMMIHHDKKYPQEYTTAENWIEMQSLQVASFLMTTCHVVLVTMDWFIDPNLLRFLQTAEMLKPTAPSGGHEGSNVGDDSPDYFPHLVFVLNKAKREDFTLANYEEMQATLHRALEHSKLKYKGPMNMSHAELIPGLKTGLPQSNVNLFLLPNMDTEENMENDGVFSYLAEYKGHSGFETVMQLFRNQLFSMPRAMLTHTTLSEKNWFHYAARTWEAVKKSSLLSEYNRLLP